MKRLRAFLRGVISLVCVCVCSQLLCALVLAVQFAVESCGCCCRYRSIQKNFDVLMTERPSFLRKEELVIAWATFEADYDQQLSNGW